ncbi:Cyclic nucleotide-binding domain containing protein [Plasmodiophora brassicae]
MVVTPKGAALETLARLRVNAKRATRSVKIRSRIRQEALTVASAELSDRNRVRFTPVPSLARLSYEFTTGGPVAVRFLRESLGANLSLNEDAIDILLMSGTQVTEYQESDTIYRTGSPSDRVYLVVDGVVELLGDSGSRRHGRSLSVANGSLRARSIATVGCFIGFQEVFEGSQPVNRVTCAQARTQCTVVSWTANDFIEFAVNVYNAHLDETVALLKAMPVFKDGNDADLLSVAFTLRRRAIPRDTRLFRAGRDDLFVIERGWVRFALPVNVPLHHPDPPDGVRLPMVRREQPVWMFGKGEIVGLQLPNLAWNATAQTDVQALVSRVDSFMQACQSSAKFAKRLRVLMDVQASIMQHRVDQQRQFEDLIREGPTARSLVACTVRQRLLQQRLTADAAVDREIEAQQRVLYEERVVHPQRSRLTIAGYRPLPHQERRRRRRLLQALLSHPAPVPESAGQNHDGMRPEMRLQLETPPGPAPPSPTPPPPPNADARVPRKHPNVIHSLYLQQQQQQQPAGWYSARICRSKFDRERRRPRRAADPVVEGDAAAAAAAAAAQLRIGNAMAQSGYHASNRVYHASPWARELVPAEPRPHISDAIVGAHVPFTTRT